MDLQLVAVISIGAVCQLFFSSLGGERCLFGRLEPDAMADDYWRRPPAAGNLRLPGHGLKSAPGRREMSGIGAAVAGRTTKLRPVGAAGTSKPQPNQPESQGKAEC